MLVVGAEGRKEEGRREECMKLHLRDSTALRNPDRSQGFSEDRGLAPLQGDLLLSHFGGVFRGLGHLHGDLLDVDRLGGQAGLGVAQLGVYADVLALRRHHFLILLDFDLGLRCPFQLSQFVLCGFRFLEGLLQLDTAQLNLATTLQLDLHLSCNNIVALHLHCLYLDMHSALTLFAPGHAP